jgi:hypothetical protein
MNGKLVWYGQLPPGGRLVLNPQGLADGPCCLASIDLLPGFARVDITDARPAGKLSVLTAAPNSLIIQNKSQETVSSIEVHWRVKQ